MEGILTILGGVWIGLEWKSNMIPEHSLMAHTEGNEGAIKAD